MTVVEKNEKQKKKRRKWFFIDVALPEDYFVKVNEIDKIKDYIDLEIDIGRTWNVPATTAPVVIEAFSFIPPTLEA